MFSASAYRVILETPLKEATYLTSEYINDDSLAFFSAKIVGSKIKTDKS